MSAPGEVEFFVDGATLVATRDEDAVDFGQNQPPRWVIATVALLIAAVVAGLLAQPQHKPAAAQTPEPAISYAAPTPTSGLGIPIPVGQAGPLIDLAVTVPLFLLQPGHLYKVAGATVTGVSLDGPAFTRVGPPAALVVDAAANRVWVLDAAAGAIIEFDARNLHRLRTLHTNESIREAAALRGHLYLARATGLADIAPGASRPKTIPGLGGYVVSVAADPKRGRLLALVLGDGARVEQVTVAGRLLHGPKVTVGGGTVRVTTDGTIWLGGFGGTTDGPVLMRLDPKTLRPMLGSPVAGRLAPSSWLEVAGDHDIWVRRASGDEGLWCVDGRTGTILQFWSSVRGGVTSRNGEAFVLVDGRLVPLVLQDCKG